MNDDQLLRYSRHILLDELGIEGQQRLLASHALVIGAGGLGSPVALYLAAAGVGTITIIDDDTVDLTNLQRQIVHDASRIGRPKAESAAASRALGEAFARQWPAVGGRSTLWPAPRPGCRTPRCPCRR